MHSKRDTLFLNFLCLPFVLTFRLHRKLWQILNHYNFVNFCHWPDRYPQNALLSDQPLQICPRHLTHVDFSKLNNLGSVMQLTCLSNIARKTVFISKWSLIVTYSQPSMLIGHNHYPLKNQLNGLTWNWHQNGRKHDHGMGKLWVATMPGYNYHV